jgi:hypothetical protein
VDYRQTVGTLVIGAAIGFVGQAILGFWQHRRTVELTERQFEHARLQDERQHEQQIEQSSRQWRREKAVDLLVEINHLEAAVRRLWATLEANPDAKPSAALDRNEANRNLHNSLSQCTALAGLITDDTLARDVVAAVIDLSRLHTPTSDPPTQAEIERIAEQFTGVTGRIGEHARSL